LQIWLIQPGEELPIDPGTPRLLRTGILAKMLVDQGHEVTYWTSTFSHARKAQRSKTDTDVIFHDNYKIKLLRSPGYLKNISIRRIYNHIILGRQFTKQAYSEKKPDIILCSMPTVELSLAATEYGRKSNVPVVLELRDMWPDIFLEVVPNWGKGIGRIILTPMFSKLKKACENATAIFGITDEFLEWGLKYAGRKRNSFDAVFYHGYSPVKPNDSEIARAESFWKQQGICRDNGRFIACFFGYFGRQFEIETILEAAGKLQHSKTDIRFVLCGNGDNYEHCKSMAKDLNNVILPGFVGLPEIWTLMRMASVGLAPYKSTANFTGNLPNKVGEYLSAGLPIISSLKGTLEHLLWENKCGITYLNSDVEKLASSLFNLSSNRQEVEKMSGNAYQLFKEKFNSNIVYLNMTNHLDFICRNYS
jgi:glycosyltransferase involved in cell wall biosynthesis